MRLSGTFQPICIYDHISLNYSWNETCFRQKIFLGKPRQPVFSNFFPDNRAGCETIWKNMAELERPWMTILYGACALRTG